MNCYTLDTSNCSTLFLLAYRKYFWCQTWMTCGYPSCILPWTVVPTHTLVLWHPMPWGTWTTLNLRSLICENTHLQYVWNTMAIRQKGTGPPGDTCGLEAYCSLFMAVVESHCRGHTYMKINCSLWWSVNLLLKVIDLDIWKLSVKQVLSSFASPLVVKQDQQKMLPMKTRKRHC